MKRKTGLIILLCLVIGCMAALTACGDGGGGGGGDDHTHTYGSEWKYNETQHWHECDDCGDKKDTANHSFSGDECTVCGYEQGGTTTAEKKPASDYFSGARLSYVNNSISDTALGGTKDFNTLLDRQLDAVAQELLVRLGKVYGQMDTNIYQVKDGGQDFTGLTIKKESIIVTPSIDNQNLVYVRNPYELKKDENEQMVYFLKGTNTKATLDDFSTLGVPVANDYGGKIDLDDAATYAYLLSTGDYAGTLGNGTTFKFQNAIQGGYTHNGTAFTSTLDNTKKWTLSYEGTFDLNSYVSTHKETVKTGLANALANTNGLSYEAAKAGINKLGFETSDVENVSNYALGAIIGTMNYMKDITSKPTVSTVSSSTELTEAQHTYKNYEVIVPAIIDSIINHKVEPSGNNAYFSAQKIAVDENASLTDSNNTYAEYTSIVLTAKAGVPVTKMEIKTATNQSGTFGYKVKASMLGMDFEITPTGGFNISSSESTFVLDFEPFLIELANRGGYPENPTLSLGTNVSLMFEPIGTSVPFRVDFSGYWSE